MKILLTLIITSGVCLIGLMIAPNPVVAKNITVPFTSQAPDARWVQPWQDLCEEASVVMVDQYYQGQPLDKTRAKKLLLHVFDIKNKTYGRSLDESTEKIAGLINNFLAWDAEVVDDPTIENIKEQIHLGQPVIIPASGKDLNNSRFRNGGPRYHMLVISGYDDEKQEFITQEPGTAYGLDFRYPYDTIMDAMHDLVSKGDIRQGEHRAIFTKKTITVSAPLDGDKDGLTKMQELSLGTSLTEKDTDKDGFTDSQEVESGYSPLVNEKKLPNNSLVKSSFGSQVFLVRNRTKQQIASETAFHARGFVWQNIKTVSDKFLDGLKIGSMIDV